MTPTRQTAFTLPATLYRYQPGPGYRQGAGISAPLPLAPRSAGLRLGVGASRHRPGPLTDTPKDRGYLTYDPAGEGRLTFIGQRTTRTWDLDPAKLQDTFTRPAPPRKTLRDRTTRENTAAQTQDQEILYLQTTQRQTVEGLATAPLETPNPFNPDQTLTYTLSNLLFNTPPTPAHEHTQARRAKAFKAAAWTAAAAALIAITGNWLANLPSTAQQAGACPTPEELVTGDYTYTGEGC